jgi:glycosyltransferase involved in cell wall biosynthesis
MRQRRILFISNLFPNPLEPHRAAFSRQQISALSELATVDVIAPIAWTSHGRRQIPAYRTFQGCDVFHPTYWYTPGILRALYGSFYRASIRPVATHLLSSRRYDLVYASWLFPDGWAAARLAEEFDLPLFQMVLGTDVNRLSPGNTLTQKSLWVADQTRKVIAVSRALKEHLVELGVRPEKIEVVYNGVDRSIFRQLDIREIRRQLAISENVRLILFVGNLKREKGLRELATAFAMLAKKMADEELCLVLIGSGPFEQEMRTLLATEGVDQYARFLGALPQQEIARWMNACDVFSLPSYSEGQPNVVIEALACGARIVATRVGGIPELDSGKGNLRLVEPRSSAALATALEELFDTEPPPLASTFIPSWRENAEQILRIFDDSLGRVI